MAFLFGNFFSTELLSGISAGATTILVPPSDALKLPVVANPNTARLVLWDGVLPPEVVEVTTNNQTGTMTIVRAKESTTAQAWAAGTQVRSVLTAEVINTALAAYFDYLVVLNANFLKLTGGTLTGPLILAADPATALGAATKQYVDGILGNKLPLAGGTMAGAINMNNNRILSLPEPVSGAEPATKTYADAILTAVNKIFADISGSLGTAGSSSAYTVTTNVGQTSLVDGMQLTVRFHTTNVLAPTLSVNGLPAKLIRTLPSLPLSPGWLMVNAPTKLVYNASSDVFLIQGANLQDFDWGAGDLKHSVQTADHNRWLMCDGRAVSRTGDTAALFAVAGTIWGVGDGATTFNILDGRGRALIGRDNMGGSAANRITNAEVGFVGTTLGASGGVQSTALTTSQLAAHNHTVNITDPGHIHDQASNTLYQGSSGSAGAGNQLGVTAAGTDTVSNTTGITAASVNNGSGTTHTNCQPSTIVNIFVRS